MPETTSLWATVVLTALGLIRFIFRSKKKVVVAVKQQEIAAVISKVEDEGPVGIVFIDDSQTDLTLIRRTVDKLGLKYRVKFIHTGAEATEFLLQNAQPWALVYVRLIVLDIFIPDVAGLELLQDIRKHEVLGHVPVVVFTGSLAKYKVAELHNAGADSCVLKAGDFEIFEKRVIDICHYWLTVNEYEGFERD
jgi:chemotaxis family two-component system response regulator Rcp1